MSMTTVQIVEAIRGATNGTFIGRYGTMTLMGWIPEFDSQGRPLNCDPNYIDSSVRIEDKEYFITRKGWHVFIWNQRCCRTACWREDKEKFILAEVDLTPDYVKEYYNKKEGTI